MQQRALIVRRLKSTLKPICQSTTAFHNCLNTIAELDNTTSDYSQALLHLTESRKKLIKASKRDDALEQYRTELIEAEWQRIQGAKYQAIEHYDSAIESAKKSGLFAEAALCAELAIIFFLEWEKDSFAMHYVQDGYSSYINADLQNEANDLSALYDYSPKSIYKLHSGPGYKQLVEKAVDVIWATDMAGRFTYLSPQYKTLTGYDPHEKLNTMALDYVHPENLDEIKQSLNNLLAGANPRNREFRHRCADGSYIWVMTRATLICDGQGLGIGTQGVLRDISEQKSIAQALQHTRDHLKLVTENMPGMIVQHKVTKAGEHSLLYVSQQCRELFEVPPEDAVNDVAPVHHRIHPDDRQHVMASLCKAAKDLSTFQIEYRVNLPKKGLRWILSTSQPELNAQGDVIFNGIVTDITDQKKTEFKLQEANKELAMANRLKDSFLANMSHELRTPLTAISNLNEGLQSGAYGSITGQQSEQMDIIRDSSNHLTDMINEVLDLSKIEAGSVDLRISKINPQELCESVLRLVDSSANNKAITLILKVSPDTPDFAADEKRIRQILVNLLSNAIKFSTANSNVTLSVENRVADKDQTQALRFSVTDTGIGLDQTQLATIFEPFYQIQTELNRSYDGISLGLSLVKRFTELHSGTVSVSSSVGKGSCFTVDLPLLTNATTIEATTPAIKERHGTVLQNTQKPSEEATPVTESNRPHILLAEDNDSVARAIGRYLEFSNFHVTRASDGETAIEMCFDLNPDLVLMDIQMPKVDGLEAIKLLRGVERFEKIPIIALTGLAMDSDEKRCIEADAKRYLSKPYRMQNLVHMIEELLETTHACRELTL